MSSGQWWWTGPTFCWLTALEDAQQVVHGHSVYHHLLMQGLSWQNPWAGMGSLPGTQRCCVRSPVPAHSPRGVLLYQGTRPSGRSHHAAALIKRQHSRSSCPSAWGSVIQATALLHRDVISSSYIVSCFHLPVIIFCCALPRQFITCAYTKQIAFPLVGPALFLFDAKPFSNVEEKGLSFFPMDSWQCCV